MRSNGRPNRKFLERVNFQCAEEPFVLAKALILLTLLLAPTLLLRAEGPIAFTQSAPTTAVFAFVEIAANVKRPVMC